DQRIDRANLVRGRQQRIRHTRRGRQRAWSGATCEPAWDRRSCPLRSVASDDAFLTQGCELVRAYAEPSAENVLDVLTEQRRRFDLWWRTVEAHRPGWHLDLTGRGMVDGLHDAALRKGWVVHEFLRVEDGAGGHASGTEQLHGLLFAVLSGPGGDDFVHL